MYTVLSLFFACSRGPAPVPPPLASPEPELPSEAPDEGWYNAACYAALDGDLDHALRLLERALERGEAPLGWLGQDPDLVEVRADPRYPTLRDAALDRYLEAHPPADAAEWLYAAQIRALQGRGISDALAAAESLGWVHALFQPELPGETPALAELARARSAYAEARRGTVTIEIPPVFELSKIVLALTTYGQDPNATDHDSAYWAEVEAWFGPHAEHPLIEALDALPLDVWSYYSFRNNAAAYRLDGDQIVPGGIYPIGGLERGSGDVWTEHLALIEDFARDSDAASFLEAHDGYYRGLIDHYEATVPIRQMWDWLEARFVDPGDGRDALLIRSSPLIGGSHNASTATFGGFTEGTMVVPIGTGEPLTPEQLGPFSRMVFTEIDHHYVNPVSSRHAAAIAAALSDLDRFNAQRHYRTPSATFNEYVTWVLFDVWWAEHCDAIGCSDAARRAGHQSSERVMERRGFPRYVAFRDAVVPLLAESPSVDAAYPGLIDWFASDTPATP